MRVGTVSYKRNVDTICAVHALKRTKRYESDQASCVAY